MRLLTAPDRAREFGIRIAIGSSRPRILRQLLIESVLVAIAGACLAAGAATPYFGCLLTGNRSRNCRSTLGRAGIHDLSFCGSSGPNNRCALWGHPGATDLEVGPQRRSEVRRFDWRGSSLAGPARCPAWCADHALLPPGHCLIRGSTRLGADMRPKSEVAGA